MVSGDGILKMGILIGLDLIKVMIGMVNSLNIMRMGILNRKLFGLEVAPKKSPIMMKMVIKSK